MGFIQPVPLLPSQPQSITAKHQCILLGDRGVVICPELLHYSGTAGSPDHYISNPPNLENFNKRRYVRSYCVNTYVAIRQKRNSVELKQTKTATRLSDPETRSSFLFARCRVVIRSHTLLLSLQQQCCYKAI